MMVLGELAEERAEQRVGEQRRCSGCPWSSGEGARVATSRELKKRRGRAAKVRVEVLLELRVERRWRSARKLMKRRGRAAEVLDEVLLEVRLRVERRWRSREEVGEAAELSLGASRRRRGRSARSRGSAVLEAHNLSSV